MAYADVVGAKELWGLPRDSVVFPGIARAAEGGEK